MVKFKYADWVLTTTLDWLIKNVDANSRPDYDYNSTSFIFQTTSWASIRRLWQVHKSNNILEVTCFDPNHEVALERLICDLCA